MGDRKSEQLVVAGKAGNHSEGPAGAKGLPDHGTLKGKTMEAMSSHTVSTKQQRIAELARQLPEVAFTSLAYRMDVDWLREAHRRTRKDGAVGIDGQTAQDYSENLEDNLRSLLKRAKDGDPYKAPPVRRVYIPKGDGTQRPLGIPTFEDKVLQRAVVMLLEPLYEQDFMDCSYGFRPKRSAHQALASIWTQLTSMGGGWVVDADIRQYFDTLDHACLREILDKRMRDGVLRRLIGKWLNAGVLDQGCLTYPETGSPQGGVISPMLANIYLHEVLDVWFEREVKPRLRGKAFLVRYADDFTMGFALEEDARRVMDVLPKRFGKFGLTIHPEKTRLVEFKKPKEPRDPGGGPGNFDFLGFTHYWAKSRKGYWMVKQKTSKKRFSRAIKRIGEWLKKNRHKPIPDQQKTLSQKLNGHYNYYGITGNSKALCSYAHMVIRLWKKWLGRRSQKAQFNWEAMERLLKRYPLPAAIAKRSVLRAVAATHVV
jgi:group II intron reverse transcriptase/maturase